MHSTHSPGGGNAVLCRQLAFSYSSEWWRLRPSTRRLLCSCEKFPLPTRPARARIDPWPRLASARQEQLVRLEPLLPLLAKYLPGLPGGGGGGGGDYGGGGGVLLEVGVGVDGGLVRALASAVGRGDFGLNAAASVRLLGVARSAEVGRRLVQGSAAEAETELVVQWGESLRGLAEATADGVDVVLGGRIRTGLDEEGTYARAKVQAKRAGSDGRQAARAAEQAVGRARENATRAAVSLVTQAGRVLRPGGALLVEADSDDDDVFMQWLQLVSPAFGGASVAQMHKSDGDGPPIWLLEKARRGAGEGETGEGGEEEEGELEIEIMQH